MPTTTHSSHHTTSIPAIIFPLIALLFACVTSHATAKPIDQVRHLTGTHWYTLSILGQRMGYAYRTTETLDTEHGGMLRETMEVNARIQLAGLHSGAEPLTMRDKTAITYDRHLQPMTIVSERNAFGRVSDTTVTIQGDEIRVVTRDPTGTHQNTLPLPDNFGSDLPLILDIMAGKAETGDRIHYSTFVPDLGKCDHYTTVITDRKTLDNGARGFVLQTTGTLLKAQMQSVVDEDGNVVSFSMPSPLNFQARRVPQQEALKQVGALVLSNSIQTGSDIPGPREIGMLRVRITPARNVDLQFLPTTPRQTVEFEDNRATVTVNVVPPNQQAEAIPIQDPEFAEYLRPSALAQLDDPTVVQKARRIIGEETNARKAAELIVRWVYENLEKQRSEPRQLSALEVLEEEKGDCTEHAILCGTLAAAVGIPAKMTTGIVYVNGAFYYHAWNELYVGEWIDIDAALGETTLDAAHIKFASSALSKEGVANAALSTGKTIGSIDIEILDHRLKQDAAAPATQQ